MDQLEINMKTAAYKLYAPQCALPDCNQQVSYHHRYPKLDGTRGYDWKTFCEHHRTVGKEAVVIFKQSRGGCENRDGALDLGFSCAAPDIDASLLEIDHWDGDRDNSDQDNLRVLCATCHKQKTKLFGDYQNRYVYKNKMFSELFQEV